MSAETAVCEAMFWTDTIVLFSVLYFIAWVLCLVHALAEGGKHMYWAGGPLGALIYVLIRHSNEWWFGETARLRRRRYKLDRLVDTIDEKAKDRQHREFLRREIEGTERQLHALAIDHPDEYLKYAKGKFKGEMK